MHFADNTTWNCRRDALLLLFFPLPFVSLSLLNSKRAFTNLYIYIERHKFVKEQQTRENVESANYLRFAREDLGAWMIPNKRCYTRRRVRRNLEIKFQRYSEIARSRTQRGVAVAPATSVRYSISLQSWNVFFKRSARSTWKRKYWFGRIKITGKTADKF